MFNDVLLCLSAITPEVYSSADKAYVSISISTPSTRTAANSYDGEVAGSDAENAVNSLNLLTFDGEDCFVEMIEIASPTSGSTFNTVEVDPSVKGFLAIVNSPDAVTVGATVQVGSAWSEIKSELTTSAQTLAAADVSGADGFMMINDGSYDGVNNSVLQRVTDDLSMDKTNPTAIAISVDRLVARFDCDVATTFDASSLANGFTATIDAYSLNATNNTTFIYSPINKITSSGTNLDYRSDPNMTLTSKDYATALTWLDNKTDVVNGVIGAYSYTLENTAGSSYHNYLNLTQAIIKATILPTSLSGLSLGDSWFAISIDGIYTPMTIADVSAAITRHRIHMMRLHTEVHLSMRMQYSEGGVVDLDMADYHVAIEACNNIYQTDSTVSTLSEEIEYTNEDELATIAYLNQAHVGTLRVMTDGICSLSVSSVDDPDNNISIDGVDYLDLLQYMLMTKEDSSLSDQEFLDLNKVWYIDLLIDDADTSGYTALSLTINGWSIWFSNTEL